MRGMIGAVGVVHFEADDLAAVEIEEQIQIEPSPLYVSLQERHIPAPDVPLAGWRCAWLADVIDGAAGICPRLPQH